MLPGGCFFENAISSLTLRGGNDGCTTTRFWDSAAIVMKEKSLIESKGSFINAGLVAWPGAFSMMEWPSGGVRTNISQAIAVLAPPRLSTTTDWPRYSPSFGASTRATMSLVPPGGKPTRKRIGFEGKGACAAAGNAAASAVITLSA